VADDRKEVVDPNDDVYDELTLEATSLKLVLSQNTDGIEGEWRIIRERTSGFSPKKQRMIWAMATCREPFMATKKAGETVEIDADHAKGSNLSPETAKALAERGVVSKGKSTASASGDVSGKDLVKLASAVTPPTKKSTVWEKFKEEAATAPLKVAVYVAGALAVAILLVYYVPKWLGPPPAAPVPAAGNTPAAPHGH
jgi:hypothetical protein